MNEGIMTIRGVARFLRLTKKLLTAML